MRNIKTIDVKIHTLKINQLVIDRFARRWLILYIFAKILEWRVSAMNRFRSVNSLQKFTSIQSQFHNLFQHQRHIETRQNFKKLRDQALAEWSGNCVGYILLAEALETS